MPRLSFMEAIASAQLEELLRDERVFLMGENVTYGIYGDQRLVDLVGADRVFDTPISENGFCGLGVGAALTGMRPIVDMSISSFLFLAMDFIVNQAGRAHYMFGGQATVPMVVRCNLFYAGGQAAHHSDRAWPIFMNMPGVKIAVPSTPHDVKGLLKTAIRLDDPVLFFEDSTLWGTRGDVPDDEYLIPFGQADIKRAGTDITVVAIAGCVPKTLKVAEQLAKDGVSVEVIDPRTLVPLDYATIMESVGRTGRLVVVDPAHHTCSAASEIAATVGHELFGELKAPIERVTTPDVPIPFTQVLERELFPDEGRITSAIRRCLDAKAGAAKV
jgi:acetoin:2,6-dichlorophenolindophenol oxidoreductase subunit beta